MASKDLTQVRSDDPATAAEGDLLYGVRSGAEYGLLAEEVAAINKGKYEGQNLQTGTTYTLVLGDGLSMPVEMNNAAANTLTVPPNSSVEFPVNTRIDIIQYGAGLTTIAAGSGVTLRGDLISQGQYKGLSLWHRATDEWVVFGGTT